MNRPHRNTTRCAKASRRAEAVFAIVVLAAAAVLAAGFAAGGGTETEADATSATAVVSRDGEIVQTIGLSDESGPETLLLEDARGSNLVEIDGGRIRVADADCPERVCVRSGWIERPGQIIACVPHGLTIVIEREGEEAPDGPDAVSG